MILSVFLLGCTEESVKPVIEIEHRSIDALVGYNESYALDVDQDGETDFLFTTSLFEEDDIVHLAYSIYPARANGVLSLATRVANLPAETSIGNGNPFEKNVDPMVFKIYEVEGESWKGDWANVEEGFIGFRLQRDMKYYYGWIKVGFNGTEEKLVVTEMAYHATADQSILAGVKD